MMKSASVTNRMIFKQAALNDLAWIIQSPGILNSSIASVMADDELLAHFPNLQDKLHSWDAHPEQIDESITNASRFVGDYFENLLMFYLKKHPNLRQVRRRQTVYQNKRSVGEFDFLFIDDRTQGSHHWEVAVKYYLRHDNRYYGPNAKDRLDLKVDKMLNKQIKLGENPAAAEKLEDYPRPILPRVLLKGRLFYPSHIDWLNQADEIDYVSPGHLRGWWCYANNVRLPADSERSHWRLIQKPYWLSSFGPENQQTELMDYNTLHKYITTHFSRSQRPLFLAELMQNRQGQYRELSRGFIVASDWPNAD